MSSIGERAAADRTCPRYIANVTVNTTSTVTAVDLSSYVGEFLYFAASTGAVFINFGASDVGAATALMYPIAAGTAEEFKVSESGTHFRAIADTTASVLSYGYTNG